MKVLTAPSNILNLIFLFQQPHTLGHYLSNWSYNNMIYTCQTNVYESTYDKSNQNQGFKNFEQVFI